MDGFVNGAMNGDDTWKGSLIGSLVGVLGGPLGVLLGGSMGMLIGGAVDDGNGWGTVKLYDREDGQLILTDEIEATHIGCEYGEYDHGESY